GAELRHEGAVGPILLHDEEAVVDEPEIARRRIERETVGARVERVGGLDRPLGDRRPGRVELLDLERPVVADEVVPAVVDRDARDRRDAGVRVAVAEREPLTDEPPVSRELIDAIGVVGDVDVARRGDREVGRLAELSGTGTTAAEGGDHRPVGRVLDDELRVRQVAAVEVPRRRERRGCRILERADAGERAPRADEARRGRDERQRRGVLLHVVEEVQDVDVTGRVDREGVAVSKGGDELAARRKHTDVRIRTSQQVARAVDRHSRIPTPGGSPERDLVEERPVGGEAPEVVGSAGEEAHDNVDPVARVDRETPHLTHVGTDAPLLEGRARAREYYDAPGPRVGDVNIALRVEREALHVTAELSRPGTEGAKDAQRSAVGGVPFDLAELSDATGVRAPYVVVSAAAVDGKLAHGAKLPMWQGELAEEGAVAVEALHAGVATL